MWDVWRVHRCWTTTWAIMKEAGFEDIQVAESQQAVESLPEDDPIVLSVLEGTGSCCLDELSAEIKGIASHVLSAKVTARKP